MKFCTYCGKEIADETVICLNCGCKNRVERTAPTTILAPITKTIRLEKEPQLAVWSKILGIVSFFVGWFVFGILAIILAYFSKNENNKKFCQSAKIGLVCGITSTVLSLSIIFVVLGFIIDLYSSLVFFLEPLMYFFEAVAEFLTILQG